MRVVGIDPSCTDTGVARSDGITTRAGRDGLTKLPIWDLNEALEDLADDIVAGCRFPTTALNRVSRAAYLDPELAIIELPSMHTSYGGQLERAGLYWKLVQRLRFAGCAVVTATAAQRCWYALGKGSGKKGEIVEKVTRLWPEYQTHGNENIADALVYLAMGLDRVGTPLTPVPRINREKALAKVVWPPDLQEVPF